jgi:hypothetical protein
MFMVVGEDLERPSLDAPRPPAASLRLGGTPILIDADID